MRFISNKLFENEIPLFLTISAVVDTRFKPNNLGVDDLSQIPDDVDAKDRIISCEFNRNINDELDDSKIVKYEPKVKDFPFTSAKATEGAIIPFGDRFDNKDFWGKPTMYGENIKNFTPLCSENECICNELDEQQRCNFENNFFNENVREELEEIISTCMKQVLEDDRAQQMAPVGFWRSICNSFKNLDPVHLTFDFIFHFIVHILIWMISAIISKFKKGDQETSKSTGKKKHFLGCSCGFC